ncbi:hypothetical protein JHC11_12170 [Idiomarina abyssalis]|uniref:Uncharacterized protein n=1 Tax=Idiomarina abyssalis TaxID=86102 RepID=A0A8I1KF95_9GAMM|nr:hypothetical protein [Idiomarina abyssalis]MBJ7316741.1 hypothetical protein [Idiomarina abyssalis]
MNVNLKSIALGAILLTAAISSSAQEQLLVDSPFVHERSMVAETGEMVTGAEVTPIYKQMVGLLPKGWNMVFTEQRLALAPVVWTKGEQWTTVLDEWGRRYGANVMIDGERQQIVVSPEQDMRPKGTAFVYSGNELHQELYNPAERYAEAEIYVMERLKGLQGTVNDAVNLHQAQAQLFGLMAQVEEREKEQAELAKLHARKLAKKKAKALAAEREVAIASQPVKRGPVTIYHDGRIEIALTKGLLKPQIEALLINTDLIKSPDEMIWRASEVYRWANDYTLNAESAKHVLGRVLSAYGLAARIKQNGIVTIDQKERI